MTAPATVHVLPVRHQPEAEPDPRFAPERRKLVLDWFAMQVKSTYVEVPEDVEDALLGMLASPDLTPAQRADAWDSVQNGVDLREGLEHRIYLPDAVGCEDMETAQETAAAMAEDAGSLYVNGTSTARGSRNDTPRGTV